MGFPSSPCMSWGDSSCKQAVDARQESRGARLGTGVLPLCISRSGRVRYHAAPIPTPTPRNSRTSRGKSSAPCRGALPPSQVVSRESRTKCHCRAPTPYWFPYQKGGKSSRTSARSSPARIHRAVLDSRVFICPLARDRLRSGQSLGRTSRGTTSDKVQDVTFRDVKLNES